MTATNDNSDFTSLSEDQAHRLLARAVELDARHVAALSIEQLREVALEAGIAAESFERALDEFNVANQSVRPPVAIPAHAPSSSPAHANSNRQSRGAGLINAWARLRAYRRPVFVAILTLSALTTPGDAVNATVVLALFVHGLFELSVVAARWLARPGGRAPASPAQRAQQPGRSPEFIDNTRSDAPMRSLLLHPAWRRAAT